jgi:cell division protein ZapE
VADPAQALIVEHLQALYERLQAPPPPPRHILRWRRAAVSAPQGLYVWGGVGRGKTWLMDLFFHSLPFEQKLRLHFHRFMRRIHHELEQLKGHQDPLQIVAARLAGEARVICLDEFHVSDIGDAMLLGQLLKGLFSQGATLVTTSNIPPDALYKDGLQRANFLPAIALLQRHTQVVELGGDIDYRLLHLEQAKTYHCPLDEQAARRMRAEFRELAPDGIREDTFIRIEGRAIPAKARANNVIWFDFDTICGSPRSPVDYIEIARCFHTVLVSRIPELDDYQNDRLRRFMHLVDEFYDRNVKLVISADAQPEALYRGTRLAFEFQRTISRLREMQSHAYLARGHRPG